MRWRICLHRNTNLDGVEHLPSTLFDVEAVMMVASIEQADICNGQRCNLPSITKSASALSCPKRERNSWADT